MDYFKISGTVRASFSFINTIEEIDELIKAITFAKQMLS
jgi:cysteine desulfurase/selenocysteine lyase